MFRILIITGIVLILVWIIGILWFALKGLFNIVLVIALISFIAGLFSRNKSN